jgi:hypothetical protein
MIITLPGKVAYLTKDAYVPAENPAFKISPIKKGVMIYNLRGVLVGQALVTERGVNVSTADSGALTVSKIGDTVEIGGLKPAKDEKKEIGNSAEKREVCGEFIFFGNCSASKYEIFEKTPREIKPKLMFRAVAHPINDRLVNIDIAEGANILRSILLCLAIGYLKE